MISALFKFSNSQSLVYNVSVKSGGNFSSAAHWVTSILSRKTNVETFSRSPATIKDFRASDWAESLLRTSPYNHLVDDTNDYDYTYEIFPSLTNGQICIKAFVNAKSNTVPVFYGRLKDFVGEQGDDNVIKIWNTYDPSRNKLNRLDPKVKARQDALAKLTDEDKIILGLA